MSLLANVWRLSCVCACVLACTIHLSIAGARTTPDLNEKYHNNGGVA